MARGGPSNWLPNRGLAAPFERVLTGEDTGGADNRGCANQEDQRK
jgi:hypothetical protein